MKTLVVRFLKKKKKRDGEGRRERGPLYIEVEPPLLLVVLLRNRLGFSARVSQFENDLTSKCMYDAQTPNSQSDQRELDA